MNIYRDWGFYCNPFQQTALSADSDGSNLLIGRSKELLDLKLAMANAPRLPTLDGINGVGKTSLANVATYQLFEDYKTGASPILFLPCRKRFQLSKTTVKDHLIDDIYCSIAETLIDFSKAFFSNKEKLRDFSAMNTWLSSPKSTSIQAGLNVLQFGISGGLSQNPNSTVGFSKHGFRSLIRDWLSEMYDDGDEGGIVCIFDNLELIEDSEDTRSLIEELRDEIFTIPGIRPVLCGANGVTLSILSSARLAGLLHKPISLKPLKLKEASEILRSRIKTYENLEGESYLPITEESFILPYDWLGKNLRSLLQFADEYCMHIYKSNSNPESTAEKDGMFSEWFNSFAQEIYEASKPRINKRSWDLLGEVIDQGGVFSPSDYSDFGFKSPAALSPHLKSLEDSNLILSNKHDFDQRKKVLHVTAHGHVSSHYRSTTNHSM